MSAHRFPLSHRVVRSLTAATLAAASVGVLLASSTQASAATTNASCQPYQQQACLFPFPDNRMTVSDRASATGLRLNLPAAGMPVNARKVRMTTTAFDLSDGFSPGSAVLIHIPQLDTNAAMARTDAVGLLDMARYTARNAPIVVINERTGKRQMIYAQLDSTTHVAAQRDLMIIPAAGWKDGQTYIVVLRNLRSAAGKRIAAPAWFRPFLKAYGIDNRFRNHRAGIRAAERSLPTRERSQFPRYLRIFMELKKAGIKDWSSFYASWNFTVASTRNLTGQLLGIRNNAFKQLGDTDLANGKVTGTVPMYTITGEAPQSFPNGTTGTVITGTFGVPCYLTTCGDSATTGFSYSGKRGLYSIPVQHKGNVGTADFECIIPSSATAADPARLSLYGHGLLGSMSEVAANPQLELASTYDIVMCATNWWGLAAPDESYDMRALENLNLFPNVVGRLQQGVLNTLLLGRLMDNPDGLVANADFQQDGKPIIQTGKLYYDGNSQGGIMGGVATAVSPDIRRAVLGVTGMDYGNMLVARSTDFGSPSDAGTFSWLLAGFYDHDNVSMYPLMLDLIDQEWDRADPESYVEGLGAHPLPDTPSHAVLMDIAYGDHQVSMYAGAAEARAIGADAYEPKGTSASALTFTKPFKCPSGTACPTAAQADRQLNDNLFFGLRPAPLNGRYSGSVIEVWDSGPGHTINPPVGDTAPPSGLSYEQDPHGDPRATPLAQQQISDFLQAGGTFVNVCEGPCHSSDYTPLP